MWDWLNCVVLFRHQYGIRCEEGAIFLECTRCGHRSHGWDVEGHGSTHQPATVPAHAVAHRRVPLLGKLRG
jgi:hypothetical protein